MRLNQSKFAKEVGCSQQNISKLIKKGILEAGDDKKLDLEYSLQKLRDYDLLDDKNKMKKSRTAKDDDAKIEETFSLPFDAPVGYKTLADLTPEEREQSEREELEAFQELEAKKKEAANKNININEDTDLRSFNYASAKAHREYYMGQIAELDYQIKLGDYILKAKAEEDFFEVARKVRDTLLNLPTKLAPRVIGKTEIREIQDILMNEIQYVLGNLSHEF